MAENLAHDLERLRDERERAVHFRDRRAYQREWYALNKERLRERRLANQRVWRARNKDKQRAYAQKRYEKHAEHVRARARLYHENHKEDVVYRERTRKRARQSRAANLERRREYERQYHAVGPTKHGPHRRVDERRDYLRILGSDPCSYCGERASSADHIDVDGPDNWNNLTAACRPCNTSKRKLSLMQFLLRRAS